VIVVIVCAAWVSLVSTDRTQRFQIFVVCILGGASLMALAVFVFLPMVRLRVGERRSNAAPHRLIM